MKRLYIILIAVFVSVAEIAVSEQVGTEWNIREALPPIEDKDHPCKDEDKIYIGSYYELSWVKQGPRAGTWELFTNRIAYAHNNIHAPYVDISWYNRLDEEDYAVDIGYNFKLENSYGRAQIGFGSDTDYIYKFQSILEYNHRLCGNLYGKVASTYQTRYAAGDVFIGSPGLVYYFDNNYVSADYGVSFAYMRDPAQWGNVKGSYEINQDLAVFGGYAFGQRLFDILPIDSSKQDSYILYGGLTIKSLKYVECRVGLSYSEEEPSFIKRGVDFNVSAKF
ncbi:MAG: YaiO family outer membrane beta-barrel protein [Candidatus Omnitrophota bacterium]